MRSHVENLFLLRLVPLSDGARALARFNVYRGAAKEMPDPLPLSEWKRPERRAPLAPNVSDFILRFSIGFAVLFGATSMGAADTNSVSGTDFQAFKIIAERNIFNPVRSGRVAQTAKPKPVKIDTVTLVGASSSETGRFAFFDGSSSEFRKVVKRGDSLAGFKIADISWNRVKLVSTNGKPMEMAIQSQMKRQDDGEWILNASPEPTLSSSAEPSSNKGGKTESASSVGESDVLKKLMQKREEELKNETK